MYKIGGDLSENEASLILHNCFVPHLIVFCVMFNMPCVDCV